MANTFEVLAKAIRNREIRLPDFQRGFSWSDAGKQRDYIASIFLAMPLGSVLLLEEGEEENFCCRRIGGRKNEEAKKEGIVRLLIDGQQRITVLMTAFSDVVYDLNVREDGSLDDLADASLRRRFFLKIPRGGTIGADDLPDVFNYATLSFPDTVKDGDDCSYIENVSHSQMSSIVDFVDMGNAGGISHQPLEENYKTNDIIAFAQGSFDQGFYRLPLFLLGRQDKLKSLRRVLESIRDLRVNEIMDDVHAYASADDRDILIRSMDEGDYPPINWADIEWVNVAGIEESDIAQIEAQLREAAADWSSNLEKYLKDSLDNIVLSQTIVSNAQKERAIEIFSIINTNATNLSSFDLMVAIAGAAKDGAGSDFRNALVNDVKGFGLDQTDYYYQAFPSTYQLQAPDTVRDAYLQSLENDNYFGVLTSAGDLRKEYEKAFGKVLVFMNAMKRSLKNQRTIEKILEDRVAGDGTAWIYKDAFVETSYQLLTPDEIALSRSQAVMALNCAGYFFQTRCGVRTISDLNYKLQYPLVACCLHYMDCLIDGLVGESDWVRQKCCEKVMALLEGWFWLSAFSKDWNSNQNDVARKDLTRLLVNVKQICVPGGALPDTSWLVPRKGNLFNETRFSDRGFVIRFGDNEADKAPEGSLRKGVLYFLLSRGLPDLLNPSRFYYAFGSESLEEHHLLPVNSIYAVERGEELDGDKMYGKLGTDTKLRNDPAHRFNSPCNFTYADKKTNNEIGTSKVSEYIQHITKVSGTHCVPGGLTASGISTKDGQLAFLGDRFDTISYKVKERLSQLGF